MNDNEKYFASLQFENKLLKANGQTFEDLFTQVMVLLYPDFRKVKAYGKLGDRKNDGFIPSENTYFQCYAPENIQKSKSNLIKKLNEDFGGLLNYWNNNGFNVEKFFFVVNDKGNGLSPEAYVELQTIAKANPAVEMKFWLMPQIKTNFLRLAKLQVMEVVGGIPTEDIGDLDYWVLAEVIGHLLQNQQPINFDENLEDRTDFDKKIILNGLTRRVESILDNANHQSGAIESYIRENAKENILNIRNRFVNYYEESKQQYPDTVEYFADKRFIFIADKALPLLGDKNKIKKIQDAIFILMSHFFEHCDLFESK
jgi:hypothetical protein